MEEEVKIENPLKVGKKIAVCPIIREGGWLQKNITKNHDGAFLYSGSKFRMKGTPYDNVKRRHVDPLTKEEIEYFESEGAGLGIQKGDLSIYKKKGFWSNFEVVLTRDPIVLNLADPMDYLRYKFLLAQKNLVAPNWESRFEKGTYKYGIKDDDVEAEMESARIEKEMTVMDYYAKVRKSARRMTALLTMYYEERQKGNSKKVPANATMNFLDTEVYKIIKKDLEWMYDLIQDKYFDERVLVSQAVKAGAIEKKGAAQYQIVGEEDVLNLRELLEFLKNNKNQAIRAKIEAQIEVQK